MRSKIIEHDIGIFKVYTPDNTKIIIQFQPLNCDYIKYDFRLLNADIDKILHILVEFITKMDSLIEQPFQLFAMNMLGNLDTQSIRDSLDVSLDRDLLSQLKNRLDVRKCISEFQKSISKALYKTPLLMLMKFKSGVHRHLDVDNFAAMFDL